MGSWLRWALLAAATAVAAARTARLARPGTPTSPAPEKRRAGRRSYRTDAADPAPDFDISALVVGNANAPPPCISNASTDLAYVNGMLSATQTLYNCLANIADPGMIATFYNGQYNGQLLVNTSITLNNLEFVDEIQSTARLQFSLRLYWRDDRYAMPLFWNQTSPETRALGLDVTTLLLNSSILMWTPELRFPDASDLNIMVSYLRLNASNVFEWGAAVDATLLQPKFDFRTYPNDEQTVNVRYIVFNFPTPLCVLGFYGGQSLKYNTNYDGSATFEENPIWDYQYTTYSTFEGNGYTYALYQIYVKRQGDGIVLRLVLPMTLLLVLAGLTFWVTFENRVDTTITLLLSISALYIVILANIPLVGYLTDVDKFVFWMFLLLVCVVVLHQTYATLRGKMEAWPLRPVYMRAIETAGRVTLIPFVLLYFSAQIEDGGTSSSVGAILTSAAVIFLVSVAGRELMGLRHICSHSLEALVAKINAKDTALGSVSWLEVLVINALIFRKLSLSPHFIAQHLARYDSIVFDTTRGLRIKDLGVISSQGMPATSSVETVAKLAAAAALQERGASEFVLEGVGVELRTVRQAGEAQSPMHSSPTSRATIMSHQDSDDDDEA